MTTAAQLMAAGADQQLIAAKLRESHEIERLSKIPKVPKVEKPRIVNKSIVTPEPEPIPTSTLPDGSLVIKHEELTQDKSSNRKPPMSVNISNAPQNTALNIPPAKDVTPERSPIEETIENLSRQRDLREVEKKKEADEAGTEAAAPVAVAEPILSGALGIEPDKVNVTLNPFMQATEQDKTILKHSFLGNQSQAEVVDHPENEKPVDMFSNVQPSEPVYSDVNNTSTLTDSPSPEIASFTQPITQPIVQPPVPDLPMPPNLPDDFSNIPPIGPAVSGYAMPVENVFTPQPQTSMPNKNDPAQFRIPGQQ